MAWVYETKTLSTDGSGNPILPGLPAGGHVSYQFPGCWVAYGSEVPGSAPQTKDTYAVIHQDPTSGVYLVGSHTPIAPQGESLDDLVDTDPGDWRTYRAVHTNGVVGTMIVTGVGDIPPGVLVALGVGAPLPAQYLPFPIEDDVVGLRPVPPWSCAEFIADDASSVWYGDNLGVSLSAIAVEVDDVRRA